MVSTRCTERILFALFILSVGQSDPPASMSLCMPRSHAVRSGLKDSDVNGGCTFYFSPFVKDCFSGAHCFCQSLLPLPPPNPNQSLQSLTRHTPRPQASLK